MLKSLDSFEFKSTLINFFDGDEEVYHKLLKLDWDGWFYKPGYPIKPNYDDRMVQVCYNLADRWLQKKTQPFNPSEKDIEGWTANQSVVFLERLQSSASTNLSSMDIILLGKLYDYSTSSNVEVTARYLSLGLIVKDQSFFKPTATLLSSVGRMKFVRPLYRLLAQCDRDFAIKTFEKNRSFYHPICRSMVEKDLYDSKA